MIASFPLVSLSLVLGLTGLGWWLAQVNRSATTFIKAFVMPSFAEVIISVLWAGGV